MNSKRRQFLWDCCFSTCFFIVVASLITLGLRVCKGGDDDLRPKVEILWPQKEKRDDNLPDPVPVVPDDVGDEDTILDDEFLVLQSSVQLIIRTFPDGIVAIDVEPGPIPVRGRFAGGGGVVETRKYVLPYVYLITAVKSGVVGVDLIPVGVTAETDIARHVLTVSDGTKPNPPPKPDPGPKPDPTPDPVTPGKLQVLVIEDTTKTTAQQANILDSAAFRQYIAGHCSSEGGSRDYLKISQLQDVSDQEPWVRSAFAKPRPSLPFIVIMSPTKETSGPLPASIDKTLEILKRLGGE